MLDFELLQMHIDGLNDRINKLRQALDYYASEQHFRDSWIDDENYKLPDNHDTPYQYVIDRGEIARDALNFDDKASEDL